MKAMTTETAMELIAIKEKLMEIANEIVVPDTASFEDVKYLYKLKSDIRDGDFVGHLIQLDKPEIDEAIKKIGR